MDNNIKLHGAGKALSKGEASRILHHLVVEDFLVEDVKKSDVYGSVSSIRFHSGNAAAKVNKSGPTPAKGTITFETPSPPPMEMHSEPKSDVNSVRVVTYAILCFCSLLYFNVVVDYSSNFLQYLLEQKIFELGICRALPWVRRSPSRNVVIGG